MTLESLGSFQSAKLLSPNSDRNTGVEEESRDLALPTHLLSPSGKPRAFQSPIAHPANTGGRAGCTPVSPHAQSTRRGYEHPVLSRETPICCISLNTGCRPTTTISLQTFPSPRRLAPEPPLRNFLYFGLKLEMRRRVKK